MNTNIENHYKGLKVLITGHTGFKGAWLAIWLKELGAEVIGYSLEAPTTPSLFELADIENKITHIPGDIRDLAHFQTVLQEHQPEIVFHLAAQSIVLEGYENPRETFDTNAMGTVTVLEAIRKVPAVKACLCITTDKCYENKNWIFGYRENDRLGGSDPYSASKAMAELAIQSYRLSFPSKTAIASARAGNVIGGGDFSKHRILPDTMRAFMENQPVEVRNPESVRPWLHVFDPLQGYLTLGYLLITEGEKFAEAWNFGPMEQEGVKVQEIVEKAIEHWGSGDWIDRSAQGGLPEKMLLRLNWDKAAHQLGWKPVYNWENGIRETVNWFKGYQEYSENPSAIYEMCVNHLQQYRSHRNAYIQSATA